MRTLAYTFLLLFSWVFAKAQVYDNPVFDRTDVPSLHIDKIEMTKAATVIHCTYVAVAGSWANISRDVYLQDEKTRKKYPLIKCDGFPFGPEKKTFLFDEKYEVSFYFSPMKMEGKIDFVENPNEQAFNIYGIDINNQYVKQYSESDIKRFSNITSFYESSGDINKAIQNKEEEIKATQYIHGVKSEAYIVSLFSLAILHDKYGMYAEAVGEMETLTKLQAELWGTNDWQYALQLRTHGQFYSHAKMHEQAIRKYKESIALYDKINIVDDQYILALNFLSHEYRSIDNEDQAIVYQNKAIQARKILGDSDKYLYEIEMMLIGGHSIDRILIAEKELNNLPLFVDTTTVAFTNVLKTMITSYENSDEYSRALYCCDRALSILKKNESENIIRVAELLGKKCRNLRWLNMNKESVETGEKAKSLFDSYNIKPDIYITILQDLAWCYLNFFDYEKSDSYLKQMEELCKEKKDWLSLAEAYNSIGNNYKYSEQLDKAEQYLIKAIEVLNAHDDARQYIIDVIEQTGNREIDNPSTLASIKYRIDIDKSLCYGELASIYQKQGKLSKAIMKEIDSGIILKEIGDEQMYTMHLQALAQYYIDDKQYENAKKKLEQIIQLDKDNKYKILPTSYALSAKISKELGKLDEAIQFYEKASKLSMSSNNLNEQFAFQAGLAGLNCDKGLYDKAEEKLSEVLGLVQKSIINDISGMKLNQKQRLWDKYELFFVKYRDVVAKAGWNPNYNSKLLDFTLFSKSLLLDSESSDKQTSQNRMSIKWRDVQKNLSENDIAIEFVSIVDSLYNSTYYALVIDKSCDYPNIITLYKDSDFEKIKQKSSNTIVDIVGNLVWKPILSQYSPKNIFFSPDGILHRMPIEYSNVDGVGEMNDNYNIFRLSSTKEIVYNIQKEPIKKAVLYGGLDYNGMPDVADNMDIRTNFMRSINERGGFEPLYETYEEVSKIDKILKGNSITTAIYTKDRGTEDSFKNLSGEKINVLHLSTHGMYVNPNDVERKKVANNFDFLELINNEKDPVKEDKVMTHSFLVMSGGNKSIQRESIAQGMEDGILTASEISHVNLRNLDLVVLSACETALGDINYSGIYGLQRGFKKAGAKTILMSLDKVDDEATRLLMVEFYRNLMSGKTKHQSLIDAQQYLRQVDNGKYDKTKYWASFIMLDGLN